MIDAAPGHRISWGVISDVVRGLYTYSVVRPIFCSFDVLQEVKVGYGFTGRIEGPVASSQLPTSLLKFVFPLPPTNHRSFFYFINSIQP